MQFIVSGVKEAFKAYGNAFSFIFKSDVDIMSKKAKKILADPDDRVEYIQAIDTLMKDGEKKEVRVKLKNDEFTLTTE